MVNGGIRKKNEKESKEWEKEKEERFADGFGDHTVHVVPPTYYVLKLKLKRRRLFKKFQFNHNKERIGLIWSSLVPPFFFLLHMVTKGLLLINLINISFGVINMWILNNTMI